MNPVAAPGFEAWLSSLGAVIVVLAIFAGLAWLLKRGRLGARGREGIAIETACSIGERRSLVIVGVEGRRLLLGVAPGQVSLLTELAPPAVPFTHVLDRASGEAGRPVS